MDNSNYLKAYFTLDYWKDLLSTFWHAMGTLKFWRELFMMTAGMSVGAAAVYYFLMPSHLIVGSISGLSIVLNTLMGGNADTFSYWVMGINAFLLLLAFLLIGNEFGAKTVYTAMILGPLTQVWDRIYPNVYFTHKVIDAPEILTQLQAGQTVLDANGNPYILNRAGEVMERVRESVMSGGLGMGDVWFDLICFVLLLSICQAFLFRINASTGGLDILGKIVNKYLHFDIGTSVAIGGILICCTAFLINDFRMVVIGILGTWINGLAIDYFTASLNKRKRVCIVSEQPERIRKYIVEDLVRGCSLYNVQGGYSGENHVEIQTLLSQDEFSALMAFIRNNKLKAFITAGNCSEVYGLWVRHKKKNGRIEAVNE
ncbi:MAG: YitT family protein [Paludibacteraceae bacterium]|nr:YitT family protein [Paludibacteraceae bacterium]MBQ9296591.1 YitT family protein [Paludibacteraceae bacterium]